MNRPDPTAGQHVGEHVAHDRAEVAELAARVTAISARSSEVSSRETQPTSRGQSKWMRRVIVLAWLTTLALGCVALLRIVYHDGLNILVLFNAFTTYVYLPAYGCLVLAIWKRRWWLTLACMSIVACHLYWLAPDFLSDDRYNVAPAPASDANASRTVRVFFANVQLLNTECEALLQEIEQADPDIIVLVEFSGPWHQAFLMSPLIAKYPYGCGFEAEYIVGVNIFSRLPIKSETQDWVTDRCIESIDVPIGSQTLRLIGLHATRPTNWSDYGYVEYWNRTLPLLASAPHPLVAVGDFNATQHSLIYKRIKEIGLRSAHEDRGRGYATTWPNGYPWLPQIRIDQAFLSPQVECLDIREGRGKGSDHRPLILDIRLRPEH